MQMTTELFNRGQEPRRYVEGMRSYRSLVKQLLLAAEDLPVDKAALPQKPAAFATISTEDWCGDSACVVPALTRLFEVKEIPFRVFRGSETVVLKEFYENSGTDHIPVLSLWNADGSEAARWVESPQAAQIRKAAWKEQHPEFKELYRLRAEGDAEATKKFGVLYRGFLEEMAVWYQDDLWSEVIREVSQLLSGDV